MALPVDPLAGKYVLSCSFPSCDGKLIAQQNYGANWSLGTVVARDPTNEAYGRCPKCKRHNMKVVEAPAPADLPGPKGFTKIPVK